MNRPARVAPAFPIDDVVVDALPGRPSTSGMSRLVPLAGVGAMVGVAAVMWGSGMVSRGPAGVLLPAMMLVSAIGVAVHAGAGRSGDSLDLRRRRYLAHLSRLSGQLADTAQRQRASLQWIHPAPSSLWMLVGGPRTWERRCGDSDFGHVRIGVGRVRLARRIVVPPVGPLDDLDPVTADALRHFVHCHAAVDDAPIAVALCGTELLVVEGDLADARALVRAMVCQLAVLHAPDAVMIAAVVGPDRRQHWDWLKWLPHNVCPHRGDSMVYDSVADLRGQSRRVVVIVDGADHHSVVGTETTVIVVASSAEDGNALRLRVGGGKLAVRGEQFAAADGMTMVAAQICARRLARHRRAGPVPNEVQHWLSELTGNSPAPLRVPLGVTAGGDVVHLDIREAAEGGHGPHGLCIGATGSGKSELLRTAVAGMIARHAPDDLNLVLIDFKGGATFLGLDGLPHVAAVMTNLADEAHLVARAKDALGGEIHRRQSILRQAGNAVNLSSYHRYRRSDPSLPPLPALFIVVDEFAELLAHQPDFAELFTMIGRVGRSLGVHLLLASQRLDEGRLRGLESHLSYRICLKTSTAAESRAVLGVSDAAELPATPGIALLRTGDGRLARFKATYLGAPMLHRVSASSNSTAQLFTSVPVAVPEICAAAAGTAWDAIVDRYRGQSGPAHRVWLPPLTGSPTLAELDQLAGEDLSAAIGLIDLPFEQRRAPFLVELGGAGGNVAVVGAPQSGKSNVVCTLITALASRHDPRRIQFYGLDFGGGALESLRHLPHVGSVANRGEAELVRRTVGQVGAILAARESRREDDSHGEIFLVVDGWSVLREDFPDLEATITSCAARGLSFGVHVILSAGRWADIRPGLKDQMGTRIELRLGDPIDSDMDRKKAALVPIDSPGRGITRDGHHFLIATPDGAGVARAGSWRAPPVRLLPALVDHAAVVDQADGDSERILLGVGENLIEPVDLDLTRQQHLLILGDRECGKTATLRALCGEIVRCAGASPAQLFVVDYRRGLLDAVDPGRLLGYVFSSANLKHRLPELISLLQSRLPTADTSIDMLKNRSWWGGPEIFVVVDDYDLVSATSPDALNPLLALLPHATDIGLHLIVARRCAGSSRAMFEPLLAQLRDSGCAALLMSGSPEEGPLIGNHRAASQPPGRGLLVKSGGTQVVQVGWCAP